MGDDSGDDAAVFRRSPDEAIVVTVDLIGPLTDDPELFGRVAAINAISDVFAMGGRPLLALNVCCFPPALLPTGVLQRILRGGMAAAAECGCVIGGGHTVRDESLKYGLAVVGTVHPARLKRNSTARVGDVLVLTKPLGTGIAASGWRKGLLDDAGMAPVYQGMLEPNRAAMEVAHQLDVSAMTDVTGFGLAGHAYTMARASGVGLRIRAGALPSYPGVLELVAAGACTGLARANRAYLGEALRVDPAVAAPQLALALDAQTSGGLLMAVAPADLERALELLSERGVRTAVRIGEVCEAGGSPFVELVP
ncbi:MAG: selenide, water dikinase [Planctomycetota bacterium]|nr:MAG: selenide, water dikinase [Planctomycetota bacterium]